MSKQIGYAIRHNDNEHTTELKLKDAPEHMHRDIENFTVVQNPYLIFRFKADAEEIIKRIEWNDNADPTIHTVKFNISTQKKLIVDDNGSYTLTKRIAEDIESSVFDDCILKKIVETYRANKSKEYFDEHDFDTHDEDGNFYGDLVCDENSSKEIEDITRILEKEFAYLDGLHRSKTS